MDNTEEAREKYGSVDQGKYKVMFLKCPLGSRKRNPQPSQQTDGKSLWPPYHFNQ